jgi:hypothetical protein
MPSLKDRQKFLTMMDEQAEKRGQEMQAKQQLEMRGAVATVEETEQSAFLKNAQGQKALVEAQVAPMQGMEQAPMQPEGYEPPPELQNSKVIAEIEKLLASAQQANAQAFKTTREAELAPQLAAQEARDRAEDRKMRAKQSSQRAAAV